MSSALASTISLVRTSSASAMASRASSLAARGSGARSAAAARRPVGGLSDRGLVGERRERGHMRSVMRRGGSRPGIHTSRSVRLSEPRIGCPDHGLRCSDAPRIRRRIRGSIPAGRRQKGWTPTRCRGRRAVSLRDAQVVGLAVDDLEPDDLPRRQPRRRPVLAPQPQGDGGGVMQVAGLFPVADLGVVGGVAAGEQERVVVRELFKGPSDLRERGPPAPETLRVTCQSCDSGRSSACTGPSSTAVSRPCLTSAPAPTLVRVRSPSPRGRRPRTRSSHRRPPV